MQWKSLLIQRSLMFGVHKMKLVKRDTREDLLQWELGLGSWGAGDQ
jgi:hypothetical protein